jgi:probable F420-dependent oxidoreductase
MKIDYQVDAPPSCVSDRIQEAEAAGYDGVWLLEAAHDPFLGVGLGAHVTSRVEIGTGIAVAFARSPMTLAVAANDLQLVSEGRFLLGLGSQIKPHITHRFSMPWSHPAARMREYVLALRAIWDCWAGDTPLHFAGRVLPAHSDDADVRSGAQPLRESAAPARRCRRVDDGGRR